MALEDARWPVDEVLSGVSVGPTSWLPAGYCGLHTLLCGPALSRAQGML